MRRPRAPTCWPSQPRAAWRAGGNCIKLGLPGKSILKDYFQENRTSLRPYLLLRISFPGRPIFIQFIPGGNIIKIGLPGKSILGDYFQENRTSRRPYLLLRISFPGRPVSIQFIPGVLHAAVGEARREDEDVVDAPDVGAAQVLGSLQHGLLLRKVIVRSN